LKTAFEEAKHDMLSFVRLNWTRLCRFMMVFSSTIVKFESACKRTREICTNHAKKGGQKRS